MPQQIRRIVPNINTDKMDESRTFYSGFLGLDIAMDMGWIVTLVSPDNPTAQVSLLRSSGALTVTPDLSLTIEVADVNMIYEKALALGIDIIYPITDEAWGVRRFHVHDPNGVIINIMSHNRL